MASDSISRRESNKLRNRGQILEAARRVFGDVGYEACSIREVIRESGLAQGTFYNYYADKESVMRAIAEDFAERVRAAIRPARRAAADQMTFLHDSFLATFEVMAENPGDLKVLARNRDVLRRMIFDGPVGAIYQELAEDLREGVKKGFFPPHPADTTARLMVALGFEVLIMTADEGEIDLNQAAKYLALLFMGGLDKVSGPFKTEARLRAKTKSGTRSATGRTPR